jgi:hypothetical protein
MAVKSAKINGQVYPLAPLHPELHDHPSPAFPLTVSPEVAKVWLTYNYRNRDTRPRGLGNYTADMSNGAFALNGDTIRFSRPLARNEDEDVPEGRPLLMDGQHRLQSCIESGQPFVTYVVYGLDPEVRRTIDTGIQRKFQDHLTMQGVKNANVLSAITARCFAWETGDRHLSLKGAGFTTPALEEFLALHPELHRSTDTALHVYNEFTGSRIRRGIVGVAHWLFMQADPEEAPWFFQRLGDGAEMPKHHPIMHLRNKIMRDREEQMAQGRRHQRVADWQILCYLIRAWNAVQEDRTGDGLMFIAKWDSDVMPTIKTAQDVADDVRVRLVRLETPRMKKAS